METCVFILSTRVVAIYTIYPLALPPFGSGIVQSGGRVGCSVYLPTQDGCRLITFLLFPLFACCSSPDSKLCELLCTL